MLQFLSVVLSDLKTLRKSSKALLTKFLDVFLCTIAKCIPHHLNEEIFQVCEQILELKHGKSRVEMREAHIGCMVEALTDKFTMRSKAHKRLTKYFLSRVVLEESLT